MVVSFQFPRYFLHPPKHVVGRRGEGLADEVEFGRPAGLRIGLPAGCDHDLVRTLRAQRRVVFRGVHDVQYELCGDAEGRKDRADFAY